MEKGEAKYPASIVRSDKDGVTWKFDVNKLVEKIWTNNSESRKQGIRSTPFMTLSARHLLDPLVKPHAWNMPQLGALLLDDIDHWSRPLPYSHSLDLMRCST